MRVLLPLCVACAAPPGDRNPADPGPVEITEPTRLLDAHGELVAPGWARGPLWTFDPARIADPDRYKFWDFYEAISPTAAMQMQIADAGLLAYLSFDHLDLLTGETTQLLVPLPTGSFALPNAPDDDYLLDAGGGVVTVSFDGTDRTVRFTRGAPGDPDWFDMALVQTDPVGHQSLGLAQPFPSGPGLFFYENKRVGLRTTVTLDTPDLSARIEGDDVNGARDWGRGAWPVEGTWTWATAGGVAEGHQVGLNLGTVHSDESRGNPNALVVDGVVHKLGDVAWAFDPDDPSAPWTFRDDEGRLEATLEPVHGLTSPLELGEYAFIVHKGRGRLTGTAVLDDGTTLTLDGLSAAAETVSYRW